MVSSTILDVPIGLLLVYLMGSLICSAIKAGIDTLRDTRANELEDNISALLQDKKLTKTLYTHPLIQNFSTETFINRLFRRASKPSYIEPTNFSTALAETLIKTGGTTEIKTTKDMASYKIRMLGALERGIDSLDNERTKNTLNSIIDIAKTKIDRLEDAITTISQEFTGWFNNSMEQLSKWYKHKCRVMIFIIAFLVSIVFNIDTIMIAKNIYQNEELKGTILTVADSIIADYTKPFSELSEEELEKVKELKSELLKEEYQLMGWKLDEPESPLGLPRGFLAIILKIIGILITSLAVAMGAPFWFDLTRKMLGLRKYIQQPQLLLEKRQ